MSGSGHVTPELIQQAEGPVAAQRVLDGIAAGEFTPAHAWLAYVELAALHGRASVACRSFIVELAKRASRG